MAFATVQARTAPLLDTVIEQVYSDLSEVRATSVCAEMLRERLDARYVGVQMLVGRTRDRFTYILRAGFDPSPRVNDRIVSLSKRAARGSMWSIDLPPCGSEPRAIELASFLSSSSTETDLCDYYAKIGIGHTMLATCYMDEDWRYLFFASRGRDQAPFGERERDTLARVTPHLRTAFRARGRFLVANAINRCMQLALEQLGVGVVILDEATGVIGLNPVAERILGEGDGLSLERTLATALPSETEQLHRLIRRTGQPGAPAASALSIWRPSGRAPLEVLVEAIRPHGGPSRAGVVLYLRDREAARPLAINALQDLFGLTDAEAQVAGRLADGLTPQAICATVGVSYHTVRAHLRSIFAKCEVENQVGLMRLILNSPACLAHSSGPERAVAPLVA